MEIKEINEIINRWYNGLPTVMGFMTSGNKEVSMYKISELKRRFEKDSLIKTSTEEKK